MRSSSEYVLMVGSIKSVLLSPLAYRAMRIGLGLVFVWAGGVKLMDPRAFARIISQYQMIPDELLAPLAIGLPILELVAGTGLVFQVRGSLGAVLSMLCMFFFVLGFGIYNNLDIDCGCFSPEELHAQKSLQTALVRDLGLIACALYLLFWRRARLRELGGAMDSTGLINQKEE